METSYSESEEEEDENFEMIHDADCAMHLAIKALDINKVNELLQNGDKICYGVPASCFLSIEPNFKRQKWAFIKKLFHLEPRALAIDGPYILLINVHFHKRVEYLINKGVSPHQYVPRIGNSLTHCSLSAKPLKTIQLLVNNEVDPNQTNVHGRTPLLNIVTQRTKKTADLVIAVDILLRHGSDPLARDLYGFSTISLLLLSTPFNSFSLLIFKKLLAAGVDPSLRNNAKSTPLMLACKLDDPGMVLQTVNELLDAGANVNGQDETGNSALLYAASNISNPCVSYEVMQSFLNLGADASVVNQYENTLLNLICLRDEIKLGMIYLVPNLNEQVLLQNELQETPLLLALKSNNTDIVFDLVKIFLKAGSDISVADYKGNTPIILAAKISDPEVAFDAVQVLLEWGADPRVRNKEGDTALHFASTIEEPNIGPFVVKMLIDAGGDPSAVNYYNESPILKAANSKNQESACNIMKTLIREGADVLVTDQNGNTPLHFVLQYETDEKYELVVMLLEKNVDPSISNINGQTPVILAVNSVPNKLNFKIIQLLLKAGAIVSEYDEIHGWTALHILCRKPASEHNYKVIESLLIAGANPSCKSKKSGSTPLHMLLQRASSDPKMSYETAELLLQYKADPNILDNEYQNVLFSFALADEFDKKYGPLIIKSLIQRSIDVNAKDSNGISAISYAIKLAIISNLDLFIKTILNVGGKHTEMDINGTTTLMLACDCIVGDKVPKVLIKAGADIHVTDNNGHTACSYAISRKNWDVIDLLFKNGASLSTTDRKNVPALVSLVQVFPMIRTDDVLHHENNIQDDPMLDFTPELQTHRNLYLQNFAKNESNKILGVMRTMLAYGVDPNVSDNLGTTPLIGLIANGYHSDNFFISEVKILLDAGANPNKENLWFYSPLNRAINNIRNSDLAYECVCMLLRYGASPFSNKLHKLTIVKQACTVEHERGPDIVKRILQLFFELGYTFEKDDSISCLTTAVMTENPYVALRNVQILIDAGVDPFDVQDDLINILDYLCCICLRNDRLQTVKYLLKVMSTKAMEPIPLKLRGLAENMLRSNLYHVSIFSSFIIKISHIIQFRTNFTPSGRQIRNFNVVRNHIKRLFRYGFNCLPEDKTQLSVITCLMTLMPDSHFGGEQDGEQELTLREKTLIVANLAQDIQRIGARTTSYVLRFQDEELELLRRQFRLPDELWMAAISGNQAYVGFMLSLWQFPGLALIAFMVDPSTAIPHESLEKNVLGLLPFLVDWGPLPIGSEILVKVKRILDGAVLRHPNFVQHEALQTFIQMHAQVPTLKSLCHYTVRSLMAGGIHFRKCFRQLDLPQTVVEFLDQDDPMTG